MQSNTWHQHAPASCCALRNSQGGIQSRALPAAVTIDGCCSPDRHYDYSALMEVHDHHPTKWLITWLWVNTCQCPVIIWCVFGMISHDPYLHILRFTISSVVQWHYLSGTSSLLSGLGFTTASAKHTTQFSRGKGGTVCGAVCRTVCHSFKLGCQLLDVAPKKDTRMAPKMTQGWSKFQGKP